MAQIKMYEVAYKEVGTDEIIVKKMDSIQLGYLVMDFAFDIISTKKIK